MPPTTVNTMSRHTSVLNPPSVPATDISLREFVVDEDAEHFNAALWRTIDQNAFILAQRDALEAFNVAKALRLSEETAAVERERRNPSPPSSTPPVDAIARSLPRSSHTHADISQAVNENRSSPSSSTSPIKSAKIPPQPSSYHYQDKKTPASTAKHSRNQLSLSTSSFPSSSSSSTAVDSRHSRSTSQSNTFTKVPSLVLPSTPSSSQNLVVVAPPLSAPQKSSTFSRNLRPGTVIPTQDTSSSSSSTPEGSRSLPPKSAPAPKKITGPKQKAYLRNPFSDLQTCPKCGNRLTIPLIQLSTPLNSRSICDALHTTCSSCRTRHCRGCTSISPCTRSCSAGQNPTSCAVRNCCYNVRAVVIFEALDIFDHIFATEAGFTPTTTTADRVDPDPHGSFHSGRQQREGYIKLLISKADKSMRKFEDAFVRTLKVICSWLQFSPEFDADDENSPAFENPSYLNSSIPHLLLASYLPEVIHTFLSNNNVRDWIAHSETYNMILETLRWISNFPTLSTNVLNLPLPPVQRNCSLKQWATGQGMMNFLGYPSHSSKKLVVEVESIGDLIKKLETHRSGLRAFAAKVQFEATLDKVNTLCDGISYLLLQQVVDGI